MAPAIDAAAEATTAKQNADAATDAANTAANAATTAASTAIDATNTAINSIMMYDCSAKGTITFATLDLAIAAVPTEFQNGGLHIKFVDTASNKYNTYILTTPTWSTSTADWQYSNENIEYAKNGTGVTVPKGKVVYINSSTGENPIFQLATNTDYSIAARTWGITYESINNNDVGKIIHFGLIENLDTSAYTAGTELWLGVNGEIINVRPTLPTAQIYIGMVIRSSATVGSIFIDLRVAVDASIQDVYKKSNYNDGDNIIDFNSINLITNSSKYIYALIDGNENLILGILRSNCHIVYGNGIPKEVEEKINEAIDIANKYSTDSVNNLSDAIFKTFGIKDTNGEFLTMSTLLSVIDNKKYSEIKLDSNANIIEARYKDTGIKEYFLPVKIQGTELSTISSNKYIFALLDGNENLIIGLNRKNANIEYGNGIPNEVQKAIESHTPNLDGYATENYVDDKIKNEGLTDIEKQSIEDYNLPVPSYYKGYLTERIAKIKKTILNKDGFNDCFIFITDVHIPNNNMQSPNLIKYLLRNTPIKKVFYGGDTPGGQYSNAKEAALKNAGDFISWLCKPIMPYGELYCINGNHDFGAAAPNWDVEQSYMPPMTLNRDIYMEQCRNKPIVFNEEDDTCVYYYFDNNIEKIRYVVINTTDEYIGEHSKYASNNNTFSKKQSDWIANKAILTTPLGYDLIVFGHVPPTAPEITYMNWLADFLKAVKNKTTYSMNGSNYDFNNAPNLMITIWGHQHADEFTYDGGFPSIIVPCDALYGDYKNGMFGSSDDYPSKTKGTIYEQTFDIVEVDKSNSLVNFIRIGGGYDRICHTEVLGVNVGETLTLNTSIGNAVWDIADATGNKSTNGYISEKVRTVASIDGGIVSTLKIGYATACAYNSVTKEMELWGIQVK